MMTLSPAEICWPASSASWVAVRRNWMTDGAYRSTSSIADGMSPRSALSRASWPGWLDSVSRVLAMRLRVVSLPAMTRSWKKRSRSSSESRSPLTSAVTIVDHTSSPGLARFSAVRWRA